jgi:hypothetical protein
MAANMVGIRKEAKETLRKLARRKGVSQQGLLTALVLLANGDREDLGIVNLDWAVIKEEFPSFARRNKNNWNVVVESVKALMDEFDSPEEIAMHSRWTVPQVARAMKEIQGDR